MACKGVCSFSEFRLNGKGGPKGEPSVQKKAGQGPYSIEGVMYCITCATFFQTDNKFVRCPCCHAVMRRASRKGNKRLRQKRADMVARI